MHTHHLHLTSYLSSVAWTLGTILLYILSIYCIYIYVYVDIYMKVLLDGVEKKPRSLVSVYHIRILYWWIYVLCCTEIMAWHGIILPAADRWRRIALIWVVLLSTT